MTAQSWTTATAPSLADIDRLARQAFDHIPAALRVRCGDVIVQVEEFPEDDVLDALGIEDPFDLTGLYHGIELTAKSVTHPVPEPDLVYLYRRPLLDEWAARGDIELGELITHVLIHEIGHHFGYSDDDMHALQSDDA